MEKLRGIMLGLVIALCSVVLSGCGLLKILPNADKYIREDRDEKWVSDIDYLEQTLPKMHKNLYFKKDEAFFKGNLEELKKKVPEYTDNEINYEMSRIVSQMGDTHTGVNLSVEKMYPISLYWYDEGIYIVDADERYKDLLYSKVISLNEIPIEEVANAFKGVFFTGANENWFKNQVMYYIISEELLKFVGVIQEDEIALQIQKPDGTEEKVMMLPITREEQQPIQDESVYKTPFYQSHPYDNYWYEYLPDKKTMYVCYRSAVQMPEKPTEIFAKELFDAIKEQDVEKLVIDVRENQGGGDPVFTPIYKSIKKSKFNTPDKLFVIIGRKTYSAGMNVAIRLKEKVHATLVGECSGGRPSHYGDTRNFKLPNSQINVRYSTEYIKHMDENLECLEPDVSIGVSAKRVTEGIDEALDWIAIQ